MSDKRVVSFGEALIRFAPSADNDDTVYEPSGRCDYVLTVAGDELNVCVDLAQLGTAAEWISVIPNNSLGRMTYNSAVQTNVLVDSVKLDKSDSAEAGVFLVVPEKRTVEYQRRNSAFSKQKPNTFDWASIFNGKRTTSWLHCTGITPAVSEGSKAMFCEALDAAVAANVSISCDLNHRPQLGTLDSLWSTVSPYVSSMQVIILSIAQMRGLAVIEGYGKIDSLPAESEAVNSEGWVELLKFFQKKWNGPGVVCCFKRKLDVDSNWGGAQRRWSMLVNSAGVHTTYGMPVWHSPKDELGGGSAWAAGLIHQILAHQPDFSLRSGSSVDVCLGLRSADLLAAMCQESFGDHSTVTLPDFDATRLKFQGKEAFVGLAEADIQAMSNGGGTQKSRL
jgi:sugar/nucleoside kinase (ribokinase family)